MAIIWSFVITGQDTTGQVKTRQKNDSFYLVWSGKWYWQMDEVIEDRNHYLKLFGLETSDSWQKGMVVYGCGG